MKVVKIFGSEHGVRKNASNRTEVADEIDTKTGVPIISLYGAKRRPTPQDLADVNVLIYDIQHVGVRFSTPTSTCCAPSWKPAPKTTR